MIKYILLIAIIQLITSAAHADSDALWNIISKECIPNQKTTDQPAPCAEVSFEQDGVHGYVAFKDRRGPLHYLLLPTSKITGIESPELLKLNSPNYFYQAWMAKKYSEMIYKNQIPDEDISLAVNSQIGRSQNQLHIHISCLRPDVKKMIRDNAQSIKKHWRIFPDKILGHHYLTRLITLEELKIENSFQIFSEMLKNKKEMKNFGLGLVSFKNEKGESNYALLATAVDLVKMNTGHIEEIQDHECPQLYNQKINNE